MEENQINAPQGQDLEIIDQLSELEQEQIIAIDPELKNLADELSDDDKRMVARLVVEGFDADIESRADWMENHKYYQELYYQTDYNSNSVNIS